MIRIILILILLVFTLGFPVADSNAQDDSASCLNLIKPLKKDRDDVQIEGGIWGIFSKIPSMGRHSSRAIEVDSKINKLIATLTYLCETRSGVPLNELASYVSRKLSDLGEDKFKSLHTVLGNPKKQIEDWLEYTKVALKNSNRVLELSKIKTSILGSSVLIVKYRSLFTEFKNQNQFEPMFSRTISLGQEIDDFFINDSYLTQANFEESQIPYWDVDENHGGS